MWKRSDKARGEKQNMFVLNEFFPYINRFLAFVDGYLNVVQWLNVVPDLNVPPSVPYWRGSPTSLPYCTLQYLTDIMTHRRRTISNK